MKNTTISRRGVVALLGATTALAACGETKVSKNGTVVGANGTVVDVFGRNPSWGREPNVDNWPEGNPAGLPTFAPYYITLVRISSSVPWKISVNHASFLLPKDKDGKPLDADARKAKAIEIFNEIAPKDKPRDRLSSTKDKGIYPRKGGAYAPNTDIVGFGEFGANQQTEIYIWIDAPTAVIDKSYVISFSPLSGTGKNADPNDSFFAKGLAESIQGGPLIVVRNYFSTYDDKTKKFSSRIIASPPNSGTKPANYAMNIHFSVPGDGMEMIPIVIDPNTGNGGGLEP